jgi:hypothetical protein
MKFSGWRSGFFSSSSTKMAIAFRIKAGKCTRPGSASILCRVSSSSVVVYFATIVSPFLCSYYTRIAKSSCKISEQHEESAPLNLFQDDVLSITTRACMIIMPERLPAFCFVSAGRNHINKYCTAIFILLQKKVPLARPGNLIYVYQHVTTTAEMARFLLGRDERKRGLCGSLTSRLYKELP